MKPLTLVTCLAQNTVAMAAALAEYLQEESDVPIQFLDDPDSNAQYRRLAAGEVDIAWSCGLPYTIFADQPTPNVELLAAPILSHPRYEGRPVYFSHVIVRADSPVQSFEELRGKGWAYNEIESFSGYRLMLAHLVEHGKGADFFANALASGGHAKSLQAVLDGVVETAAIDSTYLDWILAQDPALQSQIRVVELIGPNPVPPWIIRTAVPQSTREKIRASLLAMPHSNRGRSILGLASVDSLVSVEDQDYARIRAVAQLSKRA